MLRVAYLTAGAAGMYCGSCMHDNTLVRSLVRRGVDAQLLPLYTPIRTDENDISVDRVFFGGLNVYLQQKIPLFRHLPSLLDRFFDQPWLIRMATAKASATDPKELGAMTVSMLQGASGYQRKEVAKLCDYLAGTVKPTLVNLTNMLIAGVAPALKQSLGVPILVTLQGDDIFLDELPEPYRSETFRHVSNLLEHIDGFIVNSRYYGDYMTQYFGLDPARVHVTPLAIDTSDFVEFKKCNGTPIERPPTVGYLARLAPEKGLHVLVDAFIRLKEQPTMNDAKLKIAGWLGSHNQAYVDAQFEKLRAAGLGDAFEYVGAVDRKQKIEFLRSLDVLSTPTVYAEPKGLYVLESLAAGVPVVQPEHGAFPELLSATGGGRLFRPEDSSHLAETLHALLLSAEERSELGNEGCRRVHQQFNADALADAVLAIYQQFAE